MKSQLLERGAEVRAPRFSRGARRTALLVAVLLAVGTAAVLVQRRSGQSQYQDPHQPLPLESTTCGSHPVREPCLDIYVPGAGSFRYALLKAPTPTAETVIVDFGGPGLAALAGTINLGGFRSLYPALGQRYNILVLEEPWVTQAVSPKCDQAMSQFYRGVRGIGDPIADAGDNLARACGLALPEFSSAEINNVRWGFDAATYPEVVDAIAERHELSLQGFVAQSWGSVRLAYLARADLKFTVLLRPFPVGADASTIQRARADAIARTMPLSGRTMRTSELGERSLPVTQVDYLSAVAELGYVEDTYFKDHAATVIDGTDTSEIARLSDDLWSRYGRDTLAPGKLAQWQEICGAVARPLPQIENTVRSVSDLLAAEFAACRTLQTNTREAFTAGKTCIVTSPADTVTPEALIRRRYAARPQQDVKWVPSKERSHTSFDGLSQCLDSVIPPP